MQCWEVFRFELTYQLRQRATWLYAVAVPALAFYMMKNFILTAQENGIATNAPINIGNVVFLTTLFGLLVTAALAGDAATRDVQTRMAPLLYTAPLRERTHLAGRFLAAFVLNAALLLALSPACFADTNVTDAGLGLPEVTVTFPLEANAGEIATAVFRIENPGPGAMNGVTITFARVGNDFPIVDAGDGGDNGAVEDVRPAPEAVDAAGVVYRFEGLEEGGTTAIEFDLVHLPEFYGGAIYFDGEDAARVIDHWRGWSESLPELATTSFALFQLPEMPGVPPELANRMSLGVRFAWTGDPEEGRWLLDGIREVRDTTRRHLVGQLEDLKNRLGGDDQ